VTAVHFVIVGNLHRFRRADVELRQEEKKEDKKADVWKFRQIGQLRHWLLSPSCAA
jgi:hypothetical protein